MVGRHPPHHNAAAGAGGAVPPPASGPPPGKPVTGQPIWRSWGAQLDKVSTSWRTRSDGWTKQLQTQAREFKLPKKLGMPVNVEVDILNPAIKTVKETKDKVGRVISETWFSLPTPVQAGLPLVAVGAVGGMLVHNFESKKLKAERAKVAELQLQLERVHEEKKLLNQKVKDLESTSHTRERTASELEMAHALAEACQAAAAASTAAAAAAAACGLDDDGVMRRKIRYE